MQIKVVSYNIWHGKYLEGVIDFLKAQKPDIVCIQEAGSVGRGFANQKINIFKELESALEMKGVYGQMFWGDVGEGKFDMGNVILTNFKAEQTVKFNYERELTPAILNPVNTDRYNLPRLLLGQKLNLGKANFWVFSTHHTITSDGGVTEHQLRATRKVKEFLAPYTQYILCGDMNTPYGNKNYEQLSEGLTDLSLPTRPTLHPTIHPIGNKGFHVDYVFAKGAGIRHLATSVPLVDASDHLPVVVELEVA